MTNQPVDLQKEATAFYADNNFDVSYFPAIWHTFKVGHLVTTDLESICRPHKISIADFHLLGAIMIEGKAQRRAIDLAQQLNVSNAVLSSRIKRLQEKKLLVRKPSPEDRRSFVLSLTEKGKQLIRATGDDIGKHCHFVSCFHALPLADQEALVRIMGELHNQLDRHALSAGRGSF